MHAVVNVLAPVGTHALEVRKIDEDIGIIISNKSLAAV